MFSNVLIGDALQPIILSQDSSSHAWPTMTVNDIYNSLAKYYVLQYYLFAHLKHIKANQDQLIARGITMMQIKSTIFLFPWDNVLKQQ